MISEARIKFLSEYYSMLHGLYAVPVGLCLFLVSLWANVVQYPVRNKDLSLPVLAVLGCLLLYLAVDWYYKRTFGQIKPSIANRRRYWLAQVVGVVFAVVAFWVDVSFHLPINFIGLLFAAIFLFDKPRVTFPLNKFTLIKLILAVVIIFVSIAPLFFGKDWWSALGVRTTVIGVPIVVGLLIVLQGLAWHFFFVRSLPAVEAKDE
jgi:hypothetical protein